VLAATPRSAQAHHTLGLALLGRQAVNDAAQAFAAALAIKPDYAQALNSMGVARQILGDRSAALTCFERALALRPQSEPARHNLQALRSADPKGGLMLELGVVPELLA
jgi:Flp pilus assembly protein TadD